jgi:hypothetical protein
MTRYETCYKIDDNTGDGTIITKTPNLFFQE